MLRRNPSCGRLVRLLVAGRSAWFSVIAAPLNLKGSFEGSNDSCSLPNGMPVEIVVTGDRSEARHHFGGPLWNGGLGSSMVTPSWWQNCAGDMWDTEQISAYSR